MSYTMEGIPHDEIDLVWDDVSRCLDKALKRNNDYELEDIHTLIQERDMQCWVMRNEEGIKAAFLTQIILYPNQRVLTLPYIGGEDAKGWLHFLPLVEEYGRQNQCDVMRFFIRDGWKRVLNMEEFNKEYTCIAKEL